MRSAGWSVPSRSSLTRERATLQPLVLDLHSMCTKYSPHRLHLPGCHGGSGNGAVVDAADHARADVERGGSAPNPKAHFHLYEVRKCRHRSSRGFTCPA